jgi:hypothetical protein
MKKIFIFLINAYQATFSGWLRQLFGKGCRFEPTCSQYAKEVVQKFGVGRGSCLAIKRVLKCNPFSG